jgi:hypothetical protein
MPKSKHKETSMMQKKLIAYVEKSGVLVHNNSKCLGVVLREIEPELVVQGVATPSKELIGLLYKAGFGDNIAGLATYKNLLSQFKDDVSFLKALQQIKSKNLSKFLDDCSSSGMLALVRQVDASQNYIGVQAWKALLAEGSVFVRSSPTYFSKFMRLKYRAISLNLLIIVPLLL